MNDWSFETASIHAGFGQDPETGATSVPIVQSVSFAHQDPQELSDIFNGRKFGFSYSRIANPTVVYFENHITALEKGLASVAVASGMGAISTLFIALMKAGDHAVVSESLFGGTYYLLKELEDSHGFSFSYVNISDLSEVESSIKSHTRLIYAEAIGNPKLDIPDFSALSLIAKKNGIPLVADTTTVTAALFNAKNFGVDVVVQSVTKWVGGHGNAIGGMITDLGTYSWQKSSSDLIQKMVKKVGDLAFVVRCKKLRSNLGLPLSPFNSFLLNQGLDTLSLRMKKQCENAQQLAVFFSNHPKVHFTHYPGLTHHVQHGLCHRQYQGYYGGLLTIRLGSQEACFTLIKQLRLVKNLANLGDTKSLIIHPDSTIYRDLTREEKDRAGAYHDLLRISVGIESVQDLIQDFQSALGRIQEGV